MKWIKKTWRGEELLWKAFWLYGFLYPTAISFLISSVISASLLAFSPKSIMPISTSMGWWILLASTSGIIFILIPFTTWLIVSVWRCAFNSNNKLWGYLARVTVILFCLNLIDSVVGSLQGLSALIGNKAALYKITCTYNLPFQSQEEGGSPQKSGTEQYINDHTEYYKNCIKSLSDKEALSNE